MTKANLSPRERLHETMNAWAAKTSRGPETFMRGLGMSVIRGISIRIKDEVSPEAYADVTEREIYGAVGREIHLAGSIPIHALEAAAGQLRELTDSFASNTFGPTFVEAVAAERTGRKLSEEGRAQVRELGRLVRDYGRPEIVLEVIN